VPLRPSRISREVIRDRTQYSAVRRQPHCLNYGTKGTLILFLFAQQWNSRNFNGIKFERNAGNRMKNSHLMFQLSCTFSCTYLYSVLYSKRTKSERVNIISEGERQSLRGRNRSIYACAQHSKSHHHTWAQQASDDNCDVRHRHRFCVPTLQSCIMTNGEID
jgi:hypothetical protein